MEQTSSLEKAPLQKIQTEPEHHPVVASPLQKSSTAKAFKQCVKKQAKTEHDDSESDEDDSSQYRKICIRQPLLRKQGTQSFTQVTNPKIIFFIKPWDDEVLANFFKLIHFIKSHAHKGEVECIIEQWLIDKVNQCQETFGRSLAITEQSFTLFDPKNEEAKKKIHYAVTLGGDGTILYAAKQFVGAYIPPIISFAMGSLGYMCNFDFDEHEGLLTRLLFQDFTGNFQSDPSLDIRSRLQINVEGDPVRKVYKGGQLENFEELRIENYHVVNEIVFDRGPSPYCIQVEIYIDGNYFTTCVGDGLIISTPTGSTAYNLAAGGSIVQSNVPCISLTPLAPHSLSFRPLILPESSTVLIKKANDNRTHAWVSLDGATRFELKDGEALTIKTSKHRMAFVTDPHENLNELWADRLTQLLNWNVRPYMKPLRKNISAGSTQEGGTLGSQPN